MVMAWNPERGSKFRIFEVSGNNFLILSYRVNEPDPFYPILYTDRMLHILVVLSENQ